MKKWTRLKIFLNFSLKIKIKYGTNNLLDLNIFWYKELTRYLWKQKGPNIFLNNKHSRYDQFQRGFSLGFYCFNNGYNCTLTIHHTKKGR